MGNTSKTSKTLVEKIVAALNLTEAGRLQNFFDKQTKTLKREIEACKQNITVLGYNYKSRMDKLQEQLEDASENVESMYMNVKPEDVSNNAAQDSYAETFWSNVVKAERQLKSIEAEIEQVTKAHEEAVKEQKAQIEERERRISKIS